MKYLLAFLIILIGALCVTLFNRNDDSSVETNNEQTKTESLSPGDRFWLFRKACRSGDEIGVLILMRLGADVDGVNDYKKFIDAGYQENSGWGHEPSYPINDATKSGNIKIVKLLLEAGAKVDQPEGEGVTAIIIAARDGDKKLVQLLLDSGASLTYKGVNGWTAAGAAYANKHEDIFKLLMAAEQRNPSE